MNLFPPPGPERTRTLALIALLVIMAGVYFGPKYWPSTAATTSPSSNTEGGAKSSDKKIPLPDAVKLSELEPAPDASQAGRNPFKFGQKPLPPAPPAPPPPIYQPPPPPPPPPPPQGPPPINLKCMGITTVMPTKQLVATLQDPDSGSSQLVKDGDVWDGRYKILKVNPDSVVVSYLDGTGQRTIRNGGTE